MKSGWFRWNSVAERRKFSNGDQKFHFQVDWNLNCSDFASTTMSEIFGKIFGKDKHQHGSSGKDKDKSNQSGSDKSGSAGTNASLIGSKSAEFCEYGILLHFLSHSLHWLFATVTENKMNEIGSRVLRHLQSDVNILSKTSQIRTRYPPIAWQEYYHYSIHTCTYSGHWCFPPDFVFCCNAFG